MKRLTLCGTIAVMLAGCGRDGGEGTTPPKTIPLTVGNWWFHRNTPDTTSYDTVVIVSDTTHNGKAGFVVETRAYTPDTQYVDTFIAYYEGGFEWMTYEVQIDSPISLLITADFKAIKEENLAVGDTWTAMDRDTTIDFPPPVNIRVLVLAEVLSQEDKNVPAGNFTDCYKVAYRWTWFVEGVPYSNTTMFNWVYPGVGVIYSQDSAETDGNELVDYEVQ
ncbi:MAG: hypothetical protein ABIM59_00035 [candidate division WOR-3 bacterium]